MKIEKVQGPTMKIIRQRAQVEKMDLTAELPKLKTVLELIQLGRFHRSIAQSRPYFMDYVH